MSGEPDTEDTESAVKRVAKRPTTYVALLALAVAGLVLYASVNHDYGSSLPVYALELPLLLHLIHTAVAFVLTAVVVGWAVQHFQGRELEEGGLGPFKFAFGRTSKAIRELRGAVGKLDERVAGLDKRVQRVESSGGGLKDPQERGDGQHEGATGGPPGERDRRAHGAEGVGS